jgi:hypothetical protein
MTPLPAFRRLLRTETLAVPQRPCTSIPDLAAAPAAVLEAELAAVSGAGLEVELAAASGTVLAAGSDLATVEAAVLSHLPPPG